MNNFVFSQDPLLFQTSNGMQIRDDFEIKQKQLNDMLLQYKQLQNSHITAPSERDYIGELDMLMKSLRTDVSEKLLGNDEYSKLNSELQGYIQEELMNNIKWKINSNQKAINNIEKQKELINSEKEKVEEEDRKNLSELNDYMKNYSNITFDEYKKLKSDKK